MRKNSWRLALSIALFLSALGPSMAGDSSLQNERGDLEKQIDDLDERIEAEEKEARQIEEALRIAKGELLYAKKCLPCHTLSADETPTIRTVAARGPHLSGIMGRKAGGLAGFSYSGAMGQSKVIWNEETLDAFIRSPRRFMPGNRMVFVGLRRQQDRSDLIAYMKGVK